MIIVDTQTVIWLDAAPAKVSAKALAVIAHARRSNIPIAIADITLWEVAMGVSRQRMTIHRPLLMTLDFYASVYKVLPITPAIAEQSIRFTEPFPKDPADRLIAATAYVHGVPLVTSDKLIHKSKQVSSIW